MKKWKSINVVHLKHFYILVVVVSREVVGGGAGGARAPPIIWDFAPIQYLLNRKIPIYCVPLQYKFSDYLLDLKYVSNWKANNNFTLKQMQKLFSLMECDCPDWTSQSPNVGKSEKVSGSTEFKVQQDPPFQ